jgi:hypothetical protein
MFLELMFAVLPSLWSRCAPLPDTDLPHFAQREAALDARCQRFQRPHLDSLLTGIFFPMPTGYRKG